MANAATARAWIAAALGEAAVADHFAAVSTQLDRVAAFGIAPDRVFGFWDWVGGRYSMWSAIGLSLTIVIGPDHFEEFLRGGHDVDQHFRNAPMSHNIPVLMGLIGVWHRNIWGFPAQAVIPYDQRLAPFSGLSAAARHGVERQERDARRRALAARHRPDRLRRAGHQRPARLLPAAASGHRSGPGRFSGRGASRPTPTRTTTNCCSPIASPRAKLFCAGVRKRRCARF